MKLLSTIGSSSQQAEVDTIVRQIRDRHAQEIISFKTEVADLEAELRSYKVCFDKVYVTYDEVLMMGTRINFRDIVMSRREVDQFPLKLLR